MRSLCVVLLGLLSVVAIASDRTATNLSPPSVESLSTSIDLPRPKFATSTVKPWGFINEYGEEDGLLVRFEQELRLETGVAYENYLQPYPRVLHSLASGAVDFAVIFDSHAPKEHIIRIGDVTTPEIIIVAKKGAPKRASMEDLKGMQIGYIRGSKYGAHFDEATHFTRVPINKIQQGIAMVLKGRIEAMASTDQSLYWSMDKMGVDASKLSKVISLGETTGGLYMSKQSARRDLLPIYRKALQRMEAKGTMARIFYQQDAWASAKQPSQRLIGNK
ncbi:MAG: substrate-binding periplasmic protein [Cellvibrionaceae bacterium]